MRKEWIPNLFTGANILLGTWSVLLSWHGEWNLAAAAILLAALADGLDGRVARYFGVAGDFGRELDSLCDCVSFGVAPAVLLYVWQVGELPFYLGAFAAGLVAFCGALRLARFNISTATVHGYFQGLPIPACGCMLAGYVLSGAPFPAWGSALLMAAIAFAMISEIRYPDNKSRYGEGVSKFALAAAVAAGGWIVWQAPTRWFFAAFFIYFLFGLLNSMSVRSTEGRGE